MSFQNVLANALHGVRVSLIAVTVFQFSLGGPLASPLRADEGQAGGTATPIKHVVVLIGENRTFDNLFATYVSPSGEPVKNLLSEGVVNADGTPGPRFKRAQQFQAVAPFKTEYYISLGGKEKTPYTTLPAPTLNFSPSPSAGEPFSFGLPAAKLAVIEPSLEAADLPLLQTGSSGEANTVVLTPVPDFDTRVANFNNLPNGPFPLEGANLPYDSYTGDTTHRLFEMWQQSDCSVNNATRQNPSGCLSDLYPFVITNYTNQLDPVFDNPPAIDDNGGGNSMAFYNVQKGDVPVLKGLADKYSMSDNFHQSFMGGTGANHVMLGSGDAIFWTDSNGNPSVPPAEALSNPNPLPGTNDVYTVDLLFNGNFAACGDPAQPGIKPIRDYLGSLPYHPNPNCEASHFYMINNDSPGFLPDGTVDTGGIASGFSIPPSNVRTIGEALNEKSISWAYYGGAYTAAVKLQQLKEQGLKTDDPAILVGGTYCNICNFESYTNAIMGTPAQRTAHIKDAVDFFAAVDNGTLPAVSFLKPDGLLDGHPASSKEDLFEGMVKKVMDHLTANKELFASTVLFITMDEGGGYYDSGYIQPIDFFGDGPRIPLIAVSPFTRGGHVSHTYTDHVSILKFIERNWGLKPLTARSRDNFPNPISDDNNAYVPNNSPALGDLFDLFNFDQGNQGGNSQ